MSEGLDLISAIVQNSSSTTFRLLDPGDFVGDAETTVYDFVRRYYRRHSQMPQIDTIEDEVDLDMPDAREPVDYYLDKVQNRAMFNSVRPSYTAMRNALMDMNPVLVRQRAGEIYAACRAHNAEQSVLGLSDVMGLVRSRYEENHRTGGLTGITTGWEEFDEETLGYQNGDLIIWVARPAVGKTTILLHKARRAWMSGASCLFVSMEMPLSQIGDRFAGHHAGINPRYIKSGQLGSYAHRRFSDALVEIGSSNRFHFFAGNMQKKTDDIDVLIQELMPDIIYVDGVYLMTSPKNLRGDRYQNVAYVIDDLKQMTIMRDRPIVGTTQFGRSAGKGGTGGDMENVGYTDTIGTHASILGALRNLGRPDSRAVELLKGREGEGGAFEINYKFAPIDFSVMPPEDMPPPSGAGTHTPGGTAPEHVARTTTQRISGSDWNG